MDALLQFLKDNNLGVGIIISSIIIPLLVDLLKRRWDAENWLRQQQMIKLKEQTAAISKTKHEIFDSATAILMNFIETAWYLQYDGDRRALDSEMGKRHTNEYDQISKQTFVSLKTLGIKSKLFYDAGITISQKFEQLYNLFSDLDLLVYEGLGISKGPARPNGHASNHISGEESPTLWTRVSETLVQVRPLVDDALGLMAEELQKESVASNRRN